MTSSKQPLHHPVATTGPGQRMSFSGITCVPDQPVAPDVPLIVALPGGTYTSRYFDVPDYSLVDRAAASGIPIVAVDRPGYRDSTPVDAGESILLANAEVLDHLIAELWDEYGTGTAGVVLVGHSIGGAIVMAIAARNPSWPLLGIAVSGCLVRVPMQSRAAWDALPDVPMIELPSPMKDVVMFGPEWTYRDPMPAGSHVADAPVPKAELLDITGGWIDRMKSVAAAITVPVHSRQGEFDKLWITDDQQVDEFRTAFSAAPYVDAKLVRSAGHCIDMHRLGASLQLEQLAFALACCVKAS